MSSSVIVLEIDIDRVFAIERKCQPQVARDGNCPTPFPVTTQWMASPARNIHVVGPNGCIKSVQHPLDPSPVRGRKSPSCAHSEQLLQTLVAKGANHAAANDQ
jgi:hypothetical protein